MQMPHAYTDVSAGSQVARKSPQVLLGKAPDFPNHMQHKEPSQVSVKRQGGPILHDDTWGTLLWRFSTSPRSHSDVVGQLSATKAPKST